jgi:hypothetical protein
MYGAGSILYRRWPALTWLTFREFAAQHDAVDPCAHLRDEEGTGAAGQFGDDGHAVGWTVTTPTSAFVAAGQIVLVRTLPAIRQPSRH